MCCGNRVSQLPPCSVFTVCKQLCKLFFAESYKRFYTYIKICPLEGRPFHRMQHLYAWLWMNMNPAASPRRMLANIVMWKKSLTSWAMWHHCGFFLPWALRRKHHRNIEATVAVWLMCQTAHLEERCLRRLASVLKCRIGSFDWLGWMVQRVCDWFFLTIWHFYSVSSISLAPVLKLSWHFKWMWHCILLKIFLFCFTLFSPLKICISSGEICTCSIFVMLH